MWGTGLATRKRLLRVRLVASATRRALLPAAISSSPAVIRRFDQPGWKADVKLNGASRLRDVDEGAFEAEAGGDQPAALSGAAVDGHGKLAFDDTAPVSVDAPHDTPETRERLLQFKDVLTPPPEGVSLLGERPRRIDRSVDEQRAAILG